jgi:hypothetical protein
MRYYFNNAEIVPRQGNNLVTYIWYTAPWVIVDGVLHIRSDSATGDVADGKQPWYSQRNDITKVIVYNGVTTIGNFVLIGLANVTEIQLPNTVTTLGAWAIATNSHLTAITIPSSVTTMGQGVFENALGLQTLTVSEGVPTISAYCCFRCRALTTVNLPSTITLMEKKCFASCSSLNTINYNGTTAQWAAISKGDAWNESCPTITVHCTDGDITAT